MSTERLLSHVQRPMAYEFEISPHLPLEGSVTSSSPSLSLSSSQEIILALAKDAQFLVDAMMQQNGGLGAVNLHALGVHSNAGSTTNQRTAVASSTSPVYSPSVLLRYCHA